MGKSGPKQDVTEYRMSAHVLFSGEVDAFTGLWVNEKLAWEGYVDDVEHIDINKPDLFGGYKKEGGLIGTLTVLPGHPDQVLPEELAQKFGLTSATSPGYRHVFSLFFWGSDRVFNGAAGMIHPWAKIAASAVNAASQFVQGFMWSNNNPVVASSLWTRAVRAPKGLNPAYAMIDSDANPVHIIYEAFTDPIDGYGTPTSQMDVAAYEYAAQVVFSEGLGMSLAWLKPTEVEDFVNEITNTIQAEQFLDPQTGKRTIKLLRDDYDFDTLPEVTPDNASFIELRRRMAGEIVNEITVKFTNPLNWTGDSVTVQDTASALLHGVAHKDNNYPGITKRDLAIELATRDVRGSVAPLLTGEMEINREGWKLVPGSVFKVPSWPEEGLENIVFRVGKVGRGRPTDTKLRVSVVQDIFSLSKRVSQLAPPTSWIDPAEPPAPMAHHQILSIPYYFAAGVLLQSVPVELEYPETLAVVLAYQSNSQDTFSYDLIAEGTLADGTESYVAKGGKGTVKRVLLTSTLADQATSELLGNFVVNPQEAPRVGGFLFIGGDDEESEIVQVADFYDDKWLLTRGVLDTVPRQWPAGTPVWIVNVGSYVVDTTLRSAGEIVTYKLLSRTSRGALDEDDAEPVSQTLIDRPHLPLRPANGKVNGTAFGSHALAGAANVVFTWATRNRLLEDGQVLAYDAAAVPPEYRQSTLITIYNPSGGPVVQYAFWNETTYTIPASYLARWPWVRVEFSSARDGLSSLQNHSVILTGLANNPAAPLPPAPPVLGEPPSPVAAPADGAFYVAANVIVTEGGGSAPAIVIAGTQNNQDATGLVVRFRPDGTTDWTYNKVILLNRRFVRSAITEVAALKKYDLQIAYVVNNVLGEYRTMDDVTTGNMIAMDTISVAGRASVLMVEQVDKALEDAAAALEAVGGDANIGAKIAAIGLETEQLAAGLIARAMDNAEKDRNDITKEVSYQEHRVSVSATLALVPGQISTAKAEAIATAFASTTESISTYNTSVQAQFAPIAGQIAAAQSGAVATALTNTNSAISVYNTSVQAQFTGVAGSISTAQAAAVATALSNTNSAISVYNTSVQAQFTGVAGSISSAQAAAVATALANTNSAVTAYNVTVQSQFTGVGTAITTAKSEAITTAQSYTTGAIASYNNTVSTSAGGLTATVSEAFSATVELNGKLTTRYMMELDSGDGSVTGIYATGGRGSSGTTVSGIKLRTDKFVIVPAGGTTGLIPFSYDAVLGKLVLEEIVVKSANIGTATIDTLHVKNVALAKPYATVLASNTALPAAGDRVRYLSLVVTKDIDASDIIISFTARPRPGNNYSGYAVIGYSSSDLDNVNQWLPAVSIGGVTSIRSPVTSIRRFYGIPAGTYTFYLDWVSGTASPASGSFMEAGSYLEVTEAKRI